MKHKQTLNLQDELRRLRKPVSSQSGEQDVTMNTIIQNYREHYLNIRIQRITQRAGGGGKLHKKLLDY